MANIEREYGIVSREKETSWPKVAIIIPHYGPSPLSKIEASNTIECLQAISKITYPNFEVIIVDSGSQNGFAEEFTQQSEKRVSPLPITYIKIEENIGCTASYNLGAELAIQNGAYYLFLINNDTIVAENTLTKLVQFAEQHPEIGAIGPKVYDYSKGIKSDLLQTIGGRFIGRNYGGWQKDSGQFEQPQEVDFISGASCLIKAEVVKEIGLFDPDFFIWFEDLDFGIRLRQAGYKAYYYPAEVWHKGAQSLADRFGPRYAYYSTRNLLYILQKYSGKWRFLSVLRLISVGGKTFFGALAQGRRETLASIKNGARDGLKKRKE